MPVAIPVSSESTASSTYTPFRLVEKHFKNRSVKGQFPSLRWPSVLDLSRPESQEDDEVWRAGWWAPELDARELRWASRKGKERDLGERPAEANAEGVARRITLSDGREGYVVAEGCVLIPRYLSEEDQLALLVSALAEYTLPPNPLSLSTHYALPPSLFHLYATDSPRLIQPLHATSSSGPAPTPAPESGGRRIVETEPGSVLGYEEIVARNKTWRGDAFSEKLGAKTAGQLMREMRWANLGWVYQWSTKSYDFSREEPIEFPSALGETCAEVVRAIPWGEVQDGGTGQGVAPSEREQWKRDYRPDTGIVNFYQMNDTLMGHVDRAELDPSRPLVSISLGHAAIFLLGSDTRDQPPVPLILRSGDVLVMSGRGRQFYHGIPRVMESTLPAHFRPTESDEPRLAAAKRYIFSARININARQVFPPGFKRPDVA